MNDRQKRCVFHFIAVGAVSLQGSHVRVHRFTSDTLALVSVSLNDWQTEMTQVVVVVKFHSY